MPEDFNVAELAIPGTYIRVRAEGLIGVGGISTGNVGIVGTARRIVEGSNQLEYNRTYNLSDYEMAKAQLGTYDALSAGKLNLTRAIELLYLNGARTVYARPLDLGANDAPPGQDAYTTAFGELLKEDVNILVAPELPTATALTVLGALVESAETDGKDVIAVVGSNQTTATAIAGQAPNNKRIVFTAPGIVAYDSAARAEVNLPGNYTAAAVAGLISTLTPQSSPTNKILSGVGRLTQRFSYGELKDLVKGRVLALEERQGVRVVRGLTSHSGAFKQVTTRRIVDFAKAGIRQASDPFIGKLNNERVRKALHGAISGFLTSMVQDEALTGYTLEVTATRPDEIAGRALVNTVLQPTFSLDFVAVTMVLA